MRITLLLISILLSFNALCADGFVRNHGQWAEDFQYRADIPSGTVFLEKNAITFHMVDGEMLQTIHDRKAEPGATIKHHAFKLHFVGANESVVFEALNPSTSYNNYFLGDDPTRWKTGVKSSGTIVYKSIYDGIDLHVQHNGQTLKYEFHVASGADPRVIKIKVEGLDDLFLDKEENLVLRTSIFDIVELKPYIFQKTSKRTIDIEGGFKLEGNTIGYSIGKFDNNLPLIIDPVILFSTFSGSSADNWGFTATPDNQGFLYAGGIAFDNGYPTTTGAFDQQFNQGQYDVAITKYDTSGTQLIFSTYLGGSGLEHPHSMIVNEAGNLYVMGTTGSGNFPTTNNAYDQTFNGGPPVSVVFTMNQGSDIFVTAFNSSGTALLGSTYLGGSNTDGLNLSEDLAYNYSDEFRGEINLDEDENVFISSSTFSNNFPTTNGCYDPLYNGGQDAVITKFNPALTALVFSTYLGGSGDDAAYGVDVSTDGTIYAGGGTSSSNFPTTTGALFVNYRGGRSDGFITRFNDDGTDVLQSTFYGSAAYDQIYFMQLDRQDKPHFFGQTEHTGSNLIVNANWSDAGGGQILGVLEPDLSARVWSTQFGSTVGRPNISPTAFLVDVCNSVYISGWGGALNSSGNNNASDVGGLQTTNDAFQANPDSDDSDFYLAVVAADGNSLVFGSFYGGPITDDHVDGGTSRFDRGGQIYHSVCASCGGLSDFPIVPDPGAWSENNNSSNCNNAVFKIDFELPIIVADFNIPQFACAPFTLALQNNSVTQSSSSFIWDFGNGQTSTLTSPSVTYGTKGVYNIRLVINDPTSCNLTDTLIRTITIAQDTNFQLPDVVRCIGEPAVLGPDPALYTDLSNATVSWLPISGLDNPSSLNPSATVTQSTLYRLVIDYGGCQERILQRITIDRYPINVSNDSIVCSSFDPFFIRGFAPIDTATYEWSDDPSFVNILGTDTFLLINDLPDALNYFYFRATKTNDCQMIDTVLITVSDYDIELTPDTLVCRNDLVRISAISENPLNTFNYFWSTDGFTSDSTQVIAPIDQSYIEILLDSAQTFYLRAIGIAADGCTAEDTVRVNVSNLDASLVNATAEVDTFYRGQEIGLVGTPSGAGLIYFWTPNEYISDAQSATPTVRPKNATQYIWVVSDSLNENCTFRDTVYLTPFEILCDTPEVFVPSAFSPASQDGVNDVLYVRGKNIREVEFAVFDRWGNEVFYTEDKNVGWDGNINGKPADNAVYVYHLRAICITSQEVFMKGNVTKF